MAALPLQSRGGVKGHQAAAVAKALSSCPRPRSTRTPQELARERRRESQRAAAAVVSHHGGLAAAFQHAKAQAALREARAGSAPRSTAAIPHAEQPGSSDEETEVQVPKESTLLLFPPFGEADGGGIAQCSPESKHGLKSALCC